MERSSKNIIDSICTELWEICFLEREVFIIYDIVDIDAIGIENIRNLSFFNKIFKDVVLMILF